MVHDMVKRYVLGSFPTPVVRLERLTELLRGPRILMKRDDLSGLALGGNKIRKLEYLIAEAIESGCDAIITGGAQQSNHCCQTAAVCASTGLECHLVLSGESPYKPEGNLFLDHLLKSEIHWSGKYRKGETIPQIYDELVEQGKKPFVIPYGGSNPIGALGFVNAAMELESGRIKADIDYIIVPSSSGATQAGLLTGLKKLESETRVVGIQIDKEVAGSVPFNQLVLELANETSDLLNIDANFVLSDVDIRSEYMGKGYGIVGEAEREAIKIVAETEGIFLDPVYTGRAMAGLLDLIRNGQFKPDETVLFWHTGGTAALFSYKENLLK